MDANLLLQTMDHPCGSSFLLRVAMVMQETDHRPHPKDTHPLKVLFLLCGGVRKSDTLNEIHGSL